MPGPIRAGDPSASGGALPVAMAALSVDGRCRERNPSDLAIFGAESDRLVPRFLEADTGQAMLARSIDQGTAEGAALLVTTAGPRRFRVSLWRQRGGERIRVLAAFAAEDGGGADAALAGGPADIDARLAVLGLRGPVEAIRGVAQRLRDRAGAMGEPALSAGLSHIIAASWRLRRLGDALGCAVERAGEAHGVAEAEVDLERLVRRMVALAGPAADDAGCRLSVGAAAGEMPLVVTDETRLWTLLDALVRHRLRSGAQDLEVRVEAAGESGGCAVVLDWSAVADRDGARGPAGCATAPAGAPGEARSVEGAAPAGEPIAEELRAALLASCGAALQPVPGGCGLRVAFGADRCVEAP